MTNPSTHVSAQTLGQWFTDKPADTAATSLEKSELPEVPDSCLISVLILSTRTLYVVYFVPQFLHFCALC